MNTQKKISEVITLWKSDKKQYVKKSTFAAYALLIEKHLMPAFGNKYDIEESFVQTFVFQKLEQGLSQKTVKDMLTVLKMILKFGIKYKWLENKPLDIKFPPQTGKHHIEVLSRSNQKKMMHYIKEHFTFRNLGVYICLSTGVRIGEICALTWEDIDCSAEIIKIRKTLQRVYHIEKKAHKTELLLDTPKTKNAVRDIPMSRDLLMMLKPIKKIVNNSFFMLSNDVKPLEPRTYRDYYRNFMKELGIPELKFHGLRHSFATRCIESKCDYKTVSVLLGHSNINTTLNLYVHPDLEQKKKCIDQMLKALK